jgi:hypothetical protein
MTSIVVAETERLVPLITRAATTLANATTAAAVMSTLHDLFHRSWVGVEVLIEAGFAPNKAAVQALLRKGDPVPLRVQQYLAASKKSGRPVQPPILTDWDQWMKAEALVDEITAIREGGASPEQAYAAYAEKHPKPPETVRREFWRAMATIRRCRPMFDRVIEDLKNQRQRGEQKLEAIAALQEDMDLAFQELERELDTFTCGLLQTR